MGRIWSEDARLERWLAVEIAVVEGWEAFGKVPVGTAEQLRKRVWIDKVRIAEIEAITDHDVAAFVSQIQETAGVLGRWLHFGLTSNDIVDTAQGMALAESLDVIAEGVRELASTLKARALEFRHTVCMGRSHGIHAEPTTFGAKLAGFAFELARHRDRLAEVRPRVAVGKLAGPVGTYASVPGAVEADVLARLCLVPEDAPSQIVNRDRHAEYLAVLAGIGASAERLATEIRHLARTEVREVEEPFQDVGQKGSSSMPHKRNPWHSERISGLARLLRSYAHVGWENVPTWHERDISQSSAERVVLPDASIVCDTLVAEITQIVSGMRVYPERMLRNMDASHGLWRSQHVLLALIEAGLERDDAYGIVQRAAMKSWDEERPFLETLEEDTRVGEVLAEDALEELFELERYLLGLDVVFTRLEALEV